MGFWDSNPSYPPTADRRVSVRAAPSQKGRWETAARLHGLASAGAFLAWAGDMYLALARAWEDASHEHYDALHPAGLAEEARRREERASARQAREEG
ncbi:MAG: hypothetical protein JF614_29065 [Acidobacteria bacterium]|nr:hypothetical protein [Acidobacteriota bacterium]